MNIAASIANTVREKLSEAIRNNRERPIGTQCVDCDFFSKLDRNKPLEEKTWAVWLYKWQGIRWQRIRRLSGKLPLSYVESLDKTYEIAKKRGLERMPKF